MNDIEARLYRIELTLDALVRSGVASITQQRWDCAKEAERIWYDGED